MTGIVELPRAPATGETGATTNHRDGIGAASSSPGCRQLHRSVRRAPLSKGGDVAYRVKADTCSAKRHVRFVPIVEHSVAY